MADPHLDTDVLIRLLTGDDPPKQAAAEALFARIEAGQVAVAAPDTVIADAVYVLASPRLYHLPHAEVQALLTPLVQLPHFRVQNRTMLLRALDIFGSTTRFDFGDCCIMASMALAGASQVFSFDRDFDRVAGITRVEPET